MIDRAQSNLRAAMRGPVMASHLCADLEQHATQADAVSGAQPFRVDSPRPLAFNGAPNASITVERDVDAEVTLGWREVSGPAHEAKQLQFDGEHDPIWPASLRVIAGAP